VIPKFQRVDFRDGCIEVPYEWGIIAIIEDRERFEKFSRGETQTRTANVVYYEKGVPWEKS
jgi:hypothetical protein